MNEAMGSEAMWGNSEVTTISEISLSVISFSSLQQQASTWGDIEELTMNRRSGIADMSPPGTSLTTRVDGAVYG
jgi:hypothetical protein